MKWCSFYPPYIIIFTTLNRNIWLGAVITYPLYVIEFVQLRWRSRKVRRVSMSNQKPWIVNRRILKVVSCTHACLYISFNNGSHIPKFMSYICISFLTQRSWIPSYFQPSQKRTVRCTRCSLIRRGCSTSQEWLVRPTEPYFASLVNIYSRKSSDRVTLRHLKEMGSKEAEDVLMIPRNSDLEVKDIWQCMSILCTVFETYRDK